MFASCCAFVGLKIPVGAAGRTARTLERTAAGHEVGVSSPFSINISAGTKSPTATNPSTPVAVRLTTARREGRYFQV